MPGCLPSAWNTKITSRQSLRIHSWKCNVIFPSKIASELNDVITFCPMIGPKGISTNGVSMNRPFLPMFRVFPDN